MHSGTEDRISRATRISGAQVTVEHFTRDRTAEKNQLSFVESETDYFFFFLLPVYVFDVTPLKRLEDKYIYLSIEMETAPPPAYKEGLLVRCWLGGDRDRFSDVAAACMAILEEYHFNAFECFHTAESVFNTDPHWFRELLQELHFFVTF